MYVYALYTWMWMKPFNSVITLAWIPSICCTGWWEMPSLTPICVWERQKNEGKLLQISGQLIVTVSTNQRDNLWNQWKPVLCMLAFHYSKGLDFLRCPPPMTLYLSFLPVVSYVSTAKKHTKGKWVEEISLCTDSLWDVFFFKKKKEGGILWFHHSNSN